jgi:uncharacterized phage protein (TIGR02218 family)
MKTASDDLKTHLAGSATTLATLWKLTLADSPETVMGFTTHDQNIVYDGVTYLAATGVSNTASQSGSDLSVDNQEVTGFLDSDTISEDDIRKGVYDNAVIEVMVVNWGDLTQGHYMLRKGTLGTVKMINGVFTAELRGLTQKLTTQLGSTYGAICRAELGSQTTDDPAPQWPCGFDISTLQESGTVASSADARTITPNSGLTATSAYFDNGLITFSGGSLAGRTFEIKSWDGTDLKTFLPLPLQPQAGDAFTITPGCNHTTDDCINKFDNIVNFKGEPFIPGPDVVLNYPDAKI